MQLKNISLDDLVIKAEFSATEIDYLKENKIKSETIYCLEQMKKRLQLCSIKERTEYNFIIHEVDAKLFKSIEFISDRLKLDGFKIYFTGKHYHIDEFPSSISISFIVVDKLNNKYHFHDRLYKLIDFYKSQVLETQRKMTIKDIALIDIGELLKKLTFPFIDDTQYITRQF